jgi:hypothetical protein
MKGPKLRVHKQIRAEGVTTQPVYTTRAQNNQSLNLKSGESTQYLFHTHVHCTLNTETCQSQHIHTTGTHDHAHIFPSSKNKIINAIEKYPKISIDGLAEKKEVK